MKRLYVAVVSMGLLLAIVTGYSYADMGDGRGPTGGFHKEGMPMQCHDGHGKGSMMEREHHFSRMLASLGLDDKQTESIRAIRSKVKKDMVKKRAELEIARIDLRDLLAKDQVDMSAVETMVKKMSGLQTEIRIARIKSMQEIKAVLTPEQRKKLKEMRERGPERTPERMGYARPDEDSNT